MSQLTVSKLASQVGTSTDTSCECCGTTALSSEREIPELKQPS